MAASGETCFLQRSHGRSSELKTIETKCEFVHRPPLTVTPSSRMYSNCSGPGFALHSDIVMPYITNYGSKEQIKRFIPDMTAGKCISAIAMTEPGAGR